MSTAIEIKDLKKSFDGGNEFVSQWAESCPYQKVKITVIIGFSGTGKSVLLKHILGLMKPTSGQIDVLGKGLTQMSDQELIDYRCRLGVLFQHAALFDDMTVLENVCFPMLEHRRNWGMDRIVDTAIEKLQMSGMEEKHLHKLPG